MLLSDSHIHTMFSSDSEENPVNIVNNAISLGFKHICFTDHNDFDAKSLDEALLLAKISAEVTHNHPEGIKGAQAIAACIFLARQGKDKKQICDYVEAHFEGYNLHRTLAEIRPDYGFTDTCQTSVPESIISYLEADSYTSAIRNAISLGGDADTMACMAG